MQTSDHLYLRQANEDDAMLLFDWANDPVVRQYSFSIKPIYIDEHLSWFNKILNSSNNKLFICMLRTDMADVPVGQVRLTINNDEALIGYSIAAQHRGNGYGTRIIQLAETEVLRNSKATQIIAEVKLENIASQHIFKKLNYEESEIDGHFKYIKIIKDIVGFRVDANKQIATGHAMRCVTYAGQAIKRGAIALFFVSDETSQNFIVERGMNAVVLNSRYDDLNGEIDALTTHIRECRLTTLVIDSYFVTSEYLSAITAVVKTIYIDDLLKFAYPVNELVNYSVYADEYLYRALYGDRMPQLYLGIKYAPLRDEFKNSAFTVRKKLTDVLITTGGADKFHIADTIVRYLCACAEFDGVRFHIVSGQFADGEPNSDRMVQHKNVDNMAKLMTACDVIISAGGFTLYEACACGVPTLSVSFADNQLKNVNKFNELGLIHYCGDMAKDSDSTLVELRTQLAAMSYDIRKSISKRLIHVYN